MKFHTTVVATGNKLVLENRVHLQTIDPTCKHELKRSSNKQGKSVGRCAFRTRHQKAFAAERTNGIQTMWVALRPIFEECMQLSLTDLDE